MQALSSCIHHSISLIANCSSQRTSSKFLQAALLRTMASSPVYTAEYLSDKLKKNLDAEHIDIEDLSNCGCGMKFDALLVSPKFEGKPILQRQRLVNQILSEEMKHIHAFTMRTWTPAQWKEAISKQQQHEG